MSRLIYKIIKIFQNIVIIILLFYVILYRNSAANFKYRLLYDIHDLPCSTLKIFYHIQYEIFYLKLTKGEWMWYGGVTKPKSRLA